MTLTYDLDRCEDACGQAEVSVDVLVPDAEAHQCRVGRRRHRGSVAIAGRSTVTSSSCTSDDVDVCIALATLTFTAVQTVESNALLSFQTPQSSREPAILYTTLFHHHMW